MVHIANGEAVVDLFNPAKSTRQYLTRAVPTEGDGTRLQ